VKIRAVCKRELIASILLFQAYPIPMCVFIEIHGKRTAISSPAFTATGLKPVRAGGEFFSGWSISRHHHRAKRTTGEAVAASWGGNHPGLS